MRSPRSALIAALAVAHVISAATASGQEAPTDVLGCYDVEEGPWTPDQSREYQLPAPPPSQAGDSAAYQIPPRVELKASPSTWRGGWSLATPEGALPTPQRFKSWSMLRDSLFIGLTNGFYGIHGMLGRTGDRWTGTVVTMSDNEGSQL